MINYSPCGAGCRICGWSTRFRLLTGNDHQNQVCRMCLQRPPEGSVCEPISHQAIPGRTPPAKARRILILRLHIDTRGDPGRSVYYQQGWRQFAHVRGQAGCVARRVAPFLSSAISRPPAILPCRISPAVIPQLARKWALRAASQGRGSKPMTSARHLAVPARRRPGTGRLPRALPVVPPLAAGGLAAPAQATAPGAPGRAQHDDLHR
jgi:hypothetical protein